MIFTSENAKQGTCNWLDISSAGIPAAGIFVTYRPAFVTILTSENTKTSLDRR